MTHHPPTSSTTTIRTARCRAALRLTACLGVEVAVGALLLRLDPPAGTPPLGSAVGRWWSAHDPLDAAASAGWAIALLMTAYLVVVTALHLLAVVSRGRRLGGAATRLGPRFLVGVAATATLGTAAGAPAALAAEAPAPTGAGATMVVVDQPATATPAPHTSLPWAAPAPAAQTDPEPPPPPPAPTTAISEVVVHEGDSMWSLATDELTARLGRPPTDAEVDPYWRALIATNRDRLVHRSDPSLIYPGQSFVLPA